MPAPVITLIGGPTALIEAGGFRLLTDPTFDAPGDYKLSYVTLKKLYEGWAHFTQNADDLVQSFNALGFGARLKVLQHGVPSTIAPAGAPR